MPRPPSNSHEYKISMSGELGPFLKAFTELGLYGKTPSEVLRKMAEAHIEHLVYEKQVLTKAGYDVSALLKQVRSPETGPVASGAGTRGNKK